MDIAVDAWLPKSVVLLREYTFEQFVADLIAGVTVGLLALPLAMGFAIASGVWPQAGTYCVTGFLISALGGSKTQTGGPTGAFVVVVLGIISRYGIDGLCTCTMLAGVIPVIMGVTRVGAMVKYFPRPVVVGLRSFARFPRQLRSPRLPTTILKMAERISCKTKTFPTMPRSTGFTGLFCSG
jgi:hypothetical protein